MDDRNGVVRDRLQAIGEESFPDDDVTWNLGTIRHAGEYCFVESDPSPATVGYDRFTFVLRFTDDHTCSVVGCYCWEGDTWSLLFTDPAEKTDWQKAFAGV